MSDSLPKVAQITPIAIEVEAGKSYHWCSCGLSANQPFCDGSHRGTEFTPVQYKAESDSKVFFCGCKKSNKSPLCDGSHMALHK
ncbi:CDGSH iron-sulfur domain-containing protein [Pseudomaricurvus alkylphenolicus]|uniref:CDGSH iron-sulfur domain-containing protein n=1 Tax=Pseudomaricurvus alkylphenolicus TaxID=1306991 RepID=UPI001420E0C5|nr:CDGSH iron-sulfur domain-containing protein [Pseudomaricurvus alkylphenolicus]NIB38708.1 CDGSH iron-sulfur domain-containing protein [Pseudomaricurvus alkylphenolicus]